MKIYRFIIIIFLLNSCSSKKQIVYLNDYKKSSTNIINKNFFSSTIQSGDILKIDVQSIVPEASALFNKKISSMNINNLEVLKLEGYLVDDSISISFPVLGKLFLQDMTINDLEQMIKNLLIAGKHLKSPIVKVRKINSKFTVLGEVNNPGTFSFYDEKINLFQALGYAGDLNISAKRSKIKLIREENGLRKVVFIDISKKELLENKYFYVKDNDVFIVEPNYSKIKSAGFIGSPSSIASISSILLSITLLLINN